MQRRRKWLMLAPVMLAPWLVLAVVALEVAERYRTHPEAVSAKAAPLVAEAEAADMAICRATAAGAPKPPPEIKAKYPVLHELDGASVAARRELARRWDALLLVCTPDGRIVDRAAASQPPAIAELAAMAEEAGRLDDLLARTGAEFGADALQRVRRAHDAAVTGDPAFPYTLGKGTCTNYVIPLENGEKAGFQFMFHGVADPPEGEPVVAAVIIPWRWKVFVFQYQPHHYRRDWHPEFPESEYWTNGHGFRDEEVVLPKPPGVYRIVCIGGSTTVEGPRNDLTYPNMLEKLLQERLGADAADVVNAGVDGLTIGGALSRFEDYLALEPDIIVHYNFVNDASVVMDDALGETVFSSRARAAAAGCLAHSRFVARRFRWLWHMAMPDEAAYRASVDRLLIPRLEAMRDEARAAGVAFAVASFACPDLGAVSPAERNWFRDQFQFMLRLRLEFDDYAVAVRAFNAALRDFCARTGTPYIPVAEELKGGIGTYTDIAHMHLAGIGRKAEIMFAHLLAPAERFARAADSAR